MASSINAKLIHLVRERQFLYDLGEKDYKNRQKIKAAWLEIATEMGTEDGSYWSSKWKMLKDNYSKHRKSIGVSSNQAYKKYKNWPWAELMQFLDDFNKNRGTETNINNSQLEPHNTQENLYSKTQEKNIISPDEAQICAHLVSENLRSEIKKRKVENNAEPTDKVLVQHRMQNEHMSKLDEADHFFLSYAQSFKKLPNRMQSMIKLEIATLFARYELQHEAGGRNSNAPPLFPERSEFIGDFQNPIPELNYSSSSSRST